MQRDEAIFYQRLGDLVRGRRKERHLTQEQLAELWKLNRTTVVNIEKGRQRISVHQLVVLADYLGCASADLIPSRETRHVLSDELRVKVPDERAFSFASEIAAAGKQSK
jgi:transcriptional regulator with XRE-family HTH domain